MDERFLVRCLAVLRLREGVASALVVDDEELDAHHGGAERVDAERVVPGGSRLPHGTRDARVRGDALIQCARARRLPGSKRIVPCVPGRPARARDAIAVGIHTLIRRAPALPGSQRIVPASRIELPAHATQSPFASTRCRRAPARRLPGGQGVVPASRIEPPARDAYFVVVHSHVLRAPARRVPDGYVQRVVAPRLERNPSRKQGRTSCYPRGDFAAQPHAVFPAVSSPRPGSSSPRTRRTRLIPRGSLCRKGRRSRR